MKLFLVHYDTMMICKGLDVRQANIAREARPKRIPSLVARYKELAIFHKRIWSAVDHWRRLAEHRPRIYTVPSKDLGQTLLMAASSKDMST